MTETLIMKMAIAGLSAATGFVFHKLWDFGTRIQALESSVALKDDINHRLTEICVALARIEERLKIVED